MQPRIMPPRKPRVTGAVAPDDDSQPAAIHQGILPDDLTPDVERVLAELGENASMVTVYRMDDHKPGKWDFVARVPAPEFTVEYIKEQFGGGEYRAIIVDATQGPLNPAYFSIDRRFTGKLFPNSSTPVSVSGDAFKDDLLKMLLVKALQPAPAPAPRDDLDMVLKVAAIFKDGGNGGGGGNVAEQVNNMIQTAMTLAQTMNPPEGFAGVAASFLPVFERLVPGANSSVVPRRIPARTPTTTPSVTVQTQTPTNPPPSAPAPNPPAARVAGSIAPSWLAPFRAFSGALTALADAGNDPTTYADVALDYLTTHDDAFVAAMEAMNEGRMLADLFALAPALQVNEARKQFAAALVAAVEEGLRDIIANASDDGEDTTTTDDDTAATNG